MLTVSKQLIGKMIFFIFITLKNTVKKSSGEFTPPENILLQLFSANVSSSHIFYEFYLVVANLAYKIDACLYKTNK